MKQHYPTYPRYKDSGIDWLGKIPKHWSSIRLGSIFKERKEKVSDKIFAPLSVTKRGIVPQLATAAKTNDGDNRKGVRKGDFVINSRSDRKGSSGLAYQDGSVSLINIVLKPRDIQPKFSEYLLKSYCFIEEFYRFGHGIVDDLWTTRYAEMKGMIIPLPPKQEQTAIAQFLDKKTTEIQHLITLKEKTIALLEERRKALINRAVTRGLDPKVKRKDSGIEWLGEIPAHWEVMPLRYLGRLQNGISQGADYFGAGYPFVNYGDVYNNQVVPVKVKGLARSTNTDRKVYSVKKGDIFFTRTSETIDEIAFSSICVQTIEDAVFSGFLIRVRPFKNNLNELFSKYYFRSNLHRPFFVKEMNLVTRASLSQDLLKRLPVLIPPIEEQENIGKYLDQKTTELDQAIAQAQKEIALSKEYQQNLISEAVTGKIRITEQ